LTSKHRYHFSSLRGSANLNIKYKIIEPRIVPKTTNPFQ
jgi:hypothetical protein